MKFYLIEDRAYVETRTGPVSKTMLCLGSREEFEQADDQRKMRLVQEAVAISEYNHIEFIQGLVLH